MQKKYFIYLTFMLFGSNLFSQIAYPTQPTGAYYENLKAKVIPAIPTQEALIVAKPNTIPVNFKDTLLKYDWYEISSYYFYEKTYTSYFLDDLDDREKVQASNQFEFKRYTPKGIQYNMSLHRYKDGTLKVNHTTFDENTATKLLEVKKVGTKTMMVQENYGEKEMIEIISYNNGVMIVSVKQTPNATIKKYHIAYLAVDKTF